MGVGDDVNNKKKILPYVRTSLDNLQNVSCHEPYDTFYLCVCHILVIRSSDTKIKNRMHKIEAISKIGIQMTQQKFC